MINLIPSSCAKRHRSSCSEGGRLADNNGWTIFSRNLISANMFLTVCSEWTFLLPGSLLAAYPYGLATYLMNPSMEGAWPRSGDTSSTNGRDGASSDSHCSLLSIVIPEKVVAASTNDAGVWLAVRGNDGGMSAMCRGEAQCRSDTLDRTTLGSQTTCVSVTTMVATSTP